jgi:DEAD/DEAH box helicase domain-containing protein
VEAAVTRFEQWMGEADSPVRFIRRIPPAAGEFVSIPEVLDPALQEVLRQRGIAQLYVHQATSIRLASEGKNIVVVTPTASGKTLCYNLPILNHLLKDPNARAMYLFPTKALAEDQLHEFQAIVDAMGSGIRAFTYDGDTAGRRKPFASAPPSSSPIRTCCTAASCPTTRAGRRCSKT